MKQTQTPMWYRQQALMSLLIAFLLGAVPAAVLASGGSRPGGGGGGSTSRVDTIKVSKNYYVASNGTMLVSASSSDSAAHLYLYLPSGRYLGEVRNGGGGRYGGAVFYVGSDPGSFSIKSSSGASVTVPTAPFQL